MLPESFARKLLVLFAVFGLYAVVLPAGAGDAMPLAQNPAVEARLIAISEELRCMVCQNETLAASRADLAEDLRKEIRRMIVEGKTDAEIKDFLVMRYGDFVLYRPPVKPTTWLLWFGPLVMLVAGIAGLLVYLRRRAANLASADEPPLSASEVAEARALLGEQEQT